MVDILGDSISYRRIGIYSIAQICVPVLTPESVASNVGSPDLPRLCLVALLRFWEKAFAVVSAEAGKERLTMSETKDVCGRYPASLIGGAEYFPCALSRGHLGEHQANGYCPEHGAYLWGNNKYECPACKGSAK